MNMPEHKKNRWEHYEKGMRFPEKGIEIMDITNIGTTTRTTFYLVDRECLGGHKLRSVKSHKQIGDLLRRKKSLCRPCASKHYRRKRTKSAREEKAKIEMYKRPIHWPVPKSILANPPTKPTG